MSGKATLLASLGALTVVYLAYWMRDVRRRRAAAGAPRVLELAIGAVSNFFDTLGIGSFAPTTAAFKLSRLVPDERIPGTLNVGQTLPTVTQAFIFIAIVSVDLTTLVAMIAASVAGAWLGAGVVAGWPRRKLQVGMGCALLVAAVLFGMSNLGLFPAGGTAVELYGARLGAGIAGNFVLGALMTLGIGLYAPCMILVSLLGMDPRAAFPVMMGSCAFLMPVGSMRFIDRGTYSVRSALALAIGGVPAVFLAAYVVKALPLETLRWLVCAVVLYASVMMLRSAAVESGSPPPPPAPIPRS